MKSNAILKDLRIYLSERKPANSRFFSRTYCQPTPPIFKRHVRFIKTKVYYRPSWFYPKNWKAILLKCYCLIFDGQPDGSEKDYTFRSVNGFISCENLVSFTNNSWIKHTHSKQKSAKSLFSYINNVTVASFIT